MQCKENSVYMVSEDRILNLFSFSIAPIRPSQEAKLFPVLEKVLNLLLRQVRYHGNFSEVVPHLTSLAAGMTHFGEDKATEGILGVIGLGKKSCYSHQYVTSWSHSLTACHYYADCVLQYVSQVCMMFSRLTSNLVYHKRTALMWGHLYHVWNTKVSLFWSSTLYIGVPTCVQGAQHVMSIFQGSGL